MSSKHQTLDVVFADSAHALGVWERTVIQVWAGAPTAAATSRINRVTERLLDDAGTQKATSLTIIEGGASPPLTEAHENLAEFSRNITSRLALAAVVAEGGGFRAAMVRAVGLTIARVSHHRLTFRLAHDVASAARVLAPFLAQEGGGPTALIAAAEELRARIISTTGEQRLRG